MVHPDASFQLGYRGQWRPYFLEYERRATTPKRVPAKLESNRRYFQSGWAAPSCTVDSASRSFVLSLLPVVGFHSRIHYCSLAARPRNTVGECFGV